MGLGDKISNAKDEAVGKAKEAWGDLTDNERLEAEGRAEQLEAEGKQKVESAKDHLNDAGDKVGDAWDDAKDAASDAWQDTKDAADDAKDAIDRKI